MVYVHVTAGEVDRVGLPHTATRTVDGEERTVSNYHRLPPETLAEDGWVEAIDDPPELDPIDGIFGPLGWDLSGPTPRRTYSIDYNPPTLEADRDELPADGATAATITYRHPDPDGRPAEVTFAVNGATATVALTGPVATLDVTAAEPGTLEVSAGGLTTTLRAV